LFAATANVDESELSDSRKLFLYSENHFLYSENSGFMNYMKCVFKRESVGQWEYKQLFSGSITVSMPAYPLEHVTDIDYI
jgi:hypothetical protein